MEEVERTKASSEFVDTVTIVSVGAGEKTNLMTAAWVIPVSHNPPMIAVAISPKRFTHELLQATDEMGISILSEDQVALSREAGTKSGREIDKSSLELFELENGREISAPLLKGCSARMECKLRERVEAGDHTLFIAEVIRLEVERGKGPLLLHRRFYRSLGDIKGKYSY